jgi:tRNA nucleotidyltransferase (CCA-adding enzyme)
MKINFKKLEKNCNIEVVNIIKTASKTAKNLNINLWLVGGPVRDLILGYNNIDIDLLVDSKLREFVTSLAKRLNANFNFTSFLTAKIINYKFPIDITQTRKEIYIKEGSLPRVSKGNFYDDIKRRDFTINALAIKIEDGKFKELIDTVNGLNDLKKKYIRVIKHNSFLEDPTRIIRAIIYEQRFNFKIEPLTLKLLKKAIRERAFKLITPQRLGKVLRRALMEEHAGKLILRIKELIGLKFLASNIKLNSKDRKVLLALDKYEKKKEIKSYWLIPLFIIIKKISKDDLENLILMFQCKREEKAILLKFYDLDCNAILRELEFSLSNSQIYVKLKNIPKEIIIYLYFYSEKKSRKNIGNYLKKISNIKIKINGEDIKKLGIKEGPKIRKILEEIKYARIDELISSKEEISYAKDLIRKW